MTEHPAIAAGCSEPEIELFERIAFNDAMFADGNIIGALCAKGLLVIIESDGAHRRGLYRPYLSPSAREGWNSFLCECLDETALTPEEIQAFKAIAAGSNGRIDPAVMATLCGAGFVVLKPCGTPGNFGHFIPDVTRELVKRHLEAAPPSNPQAAE
jgi:hypothetical protein